MASQATDPEASSWTAPSGSWASSEAARRSMRGNRNRDTRPEMAVRRAVHALGLRYRVAARPIRGIRRSADLVFRRSRVAVFVDGCFWHGCPVHGRKTSFTGPNAALWQEKMKRNAERDRRSTALAQEDGWNVIRVWECDVRDDPRGVATFLLTER